MIVILMEYVRTQHVIVMKALLGNIVNTNHARMNAVIRVNAVRMEHASVIKDILELTVLHRIVLMTVTAMGNVLVVSVSAMINGVELIVWKNLALLIAIIMDFVNKVFVTVKMSSLDLIVRYLDVLIHAHRTAGVIMEPVLVI